MLCSCGSFSMICQLSCTDLENCLPFNEYGVTIGMAVWDLMPLEFCGEECYESGRGL